MKNQLSADYRGRIAEKVMEWGNLVFIGLAIGQAFFNELNLLLTGLGVFIFTGAYAFSFHFMKLGKGVSKQ